MNTIKYNPDIHQQEMVTKFLNMRVIANNNFVSEVIETLEKNVPEVELYMVSYRDKQALCRKGLNPAIETRETQHKHYYALKKDGRILAVGKNSRRIENIKKRLNNVLTDPDKLGILNFSGKMTTAERCSRLGYELVTQDKPF